jgi:thioredoxin reductase (NADPH)
MIDLLIVGAGPAGLAAAVQGARDGLSVRLLSDEQPGGLVRAAFNVENWPGYPGGIAGNGVADRLSGHAEQFGVVCQRAFVEKVRWQGASFLADARFADGSVEYVESRTILAATGTSPVAWTVEGLDGIPPSIAAERIHRDVRTLPVILSDSCVVVIGGGEAALDSALTAAARGADVRVFVRGSQIRAGQRLTGMALAAGVSVSTGCDVFKIDFDEAGRRLVLQIRPDPSGISGAPGCAAVERLFADQLLVCTGRIPNLDALGGILPGPALPGDIATAHPALFMAGDVIRGRDRFVATAVGDGVRAAILAARYIKENQ